MLMQPNVTESAPNSFTALFPSLTMAWKDSSLFSLTTGTEKPMGWTDTSFSRPSHDRFKDAELIILEPKKLTAMDQISDEARFLKTSLTLERKKMSHAFKEVIELMEAI